jgi:predicted dehydrogenase
MPVTADDLDAAHCFAAAEAAGRVVVEGFMWRHHPQTVLARRLVAEGGDRAAVDHPGGAVCGRPTAEQRAMRRHGSLRPPVSAAVRCLQRSHARPGASK